MRSLIKVQLEVVGGHYLLARAPGGRLSPELRELVDQTAELLLAHLIGERLRCVMEHKRDEAPPADTVALGGAPICFLHAEGEER